LRVSRRIISEAAFISSTPEAISELPVPIPDRPYPLEVHRPDVKTIFGELIHQRVFAMTRNRQIETRPRGNRGTVRQKKDGPGFPLRILALPAFSEDVKCDIAFLSPVFAAPDLCAWGRTCRLRWGILLCAEKIPRERLPSSRERRGTRVKRARRESSSSIHKSP